jgi:hypothetical protein
MSGARWTEQRLEGYLAPDQAQQYHNVPFEMPEGVHRLEVSYEYSHAIGSDPHLTGGNTLDIGLFDQRGAAYPGRGFRGWTGSARSTFFIAHDDATPGYLPGPLDPGEWNVSLGFYKSAPEGCHYTIALRFLIGENSESPALPTLLTLANSRASLPARAGGWYRGELHCHSHHSDGDSDPRDLIATAKALGLDFLAITDHNSISHLAALAALDPGELVLIPGCEVTTYKGHWNVWGLEEWIDFRTLTPDLMRQSIRRAVELGYLTSCNHPRAMGPPWEFKAITGQHCIEVWNGPWQLFNSESLAYWESRLRNGERLVAVGGSDAHYLSRPHIARIGTPTTWIYCPDAPTAASLLDGLRAGHAFISDAPDGPQVYLECGDAMMGDGVPRPADGSLDVSARVVNGAGLRLEFHSAEGRLAQVGIYSENQSIRLTVPVTNTPYLRAQLVETAGEPGMVRALTNPIYIEQTEVSA